MILVVNMIPNICYTWTHIFQLNEAIGILIPTAAVQILDSYIRWHDEMTKSTVKSILNNGLYRPVCLTCRYFAKRESGKPRTTKPTSQPSFAEQDWLSTNTRTEHQPLLFSCLRTDTDSFCTKIWTSDCFLSRFN